MFLEEWEGEIIMIFRVKFEKEVSEVDMLSTVVLEELISSLLERSHTLMQLAHYNIYIYIYSAQYCVYSILNIISKFIYIYIYIKYIVIFKHVYIYIN